MKVTFNFKHLEPLKSITDYAEAKIEKMEKYALHKEEKVHFIFSVNKHEQIAEVILDAGPVHFTATATDLKLYGAIDGAVEKLERQLAKHKDKVQDHKLHGENGRKTVVEDVG